jgi:EmrB/QacA subfamily drug resistance transporter
VFTNEERRITLAGVLLVFLLAGLDQTIVSTAMPRIVSQLNGLNLYAWVTTAYMLSSTVMVPIYGKLNDIYGRKPVLITGVLIFLFGSMLCGLAGEFGDLPLLGGGMTQLIVFRALQGIGGGALFTSAFAIIADLYPPRERAKFAGMFGAVFGLTSILGPVIGGFFTDLGVTYIGGLEVAGWRWIFYVNLPISLLALFMIVAKMPQLLHRAPGKIDFAGAALIVVTFVPLLLALSWGGRDYPWSSPTILGLLGLSAVGLVAFVAVEKAVSNPILALDLFKNRTFTTANLTSFVTSAAFMGSVTFLPLYMQIGQGIPATASGLVMLPMMVGMVASSGINGQLISRTGHYKPYLILGAAMIVLGLWLLSRCTVETSTLDLSWRVLILGVGLGPSMGTFNMVVQAALPKTRLGVGTSATQFFRQIGGAVGVAVFGSIMTQSVAMASAHAGLGKTIDLNAMRELATHQIGEAGAAAGAAPHQMDMGVRIIVAEAVTHVFLAGSIVAVLAVLLTVLIPAAKLEHARAHAPEPPEG